MSKDAVQGPRHLGEIQRVDEEACVLDLATAACAHETPKLRLDGPSSLRRLLLHDPERCKVTLRIDDLFDRGGTERADQLVLQVCDAHVETERFHVGAREVRAEAGPFETALKRAFLSGIAEACQSDVQPSWTEEVQEVSDGRRTAYRHNRDAVRVKLPTTALGERFKGDLVADPFDKHDRA
jgi:hypothetical protein